MAFDWTEFLAVAEHVRTVTPATCTTEALLRSVVGRAYYAAYGVAKQYALLHLDFRTHNQPDDHERLPWRLINHGLPLAGIRLKELRSWRNACDDAGEVVDLEQLASDALRWARQILDDIARHRASST